MTINLFIIENFVLIFSHSAPSKICLHLFLWLGSFSDFSAFHTRKLLTKRRGLTKLLQSLANHRRSKATAKKGLSCNLTKCHPHLWALILSVKEWKKPSKWLQERRWRPRLLKLRLLMWKKKPMGKKSIWKHFCYQLALEVGGLLWKA